LLIVNFYDNAKMTISDEIVSTDDGLSAIGGNLYIECVDGTCKVANGYVINNDKVYKIENGRGSDGVLTKV